MIGKTTNALNVEKQVSRIWGGTLSSASFYFSPAHSLFLLFSALTLRLARGDTGPPEYPIQSV